MRPFEYHWKVGEREHELRYSFAARRAFERKHKMSVTGLLQRIANPAEQKADDIIALLLLLLSSTEPDMSIEDAERLVDEAGGEDDVLKILIEAIGGQSAGEGGDPNP